MIRIGKEVDAGTTPEDLSTQERGEIDKIWVRLSLEPISSFKNQEGEISDLQLAYASER